MSQGSLFNNGDQDAPPERLTEQERICVDHVRSQPWHDGGGATPGETNEALGWEGRSSVSARFPALARKGLITFRINQFSGEPIMRDTPRGGRPAMVYWPSDEWILRQIRRGSAS